MRADAFVLLGLCLAACGGGRTAARAADGEGVGLPAPATSLALGDLASGQGLDTLWATHPGGLSTVTPRIEGGAALTHTLALPGADPVAAVTDGELTYVLDRASERVLVFSGDEHVGFVPRATLKVGTRPSALLLGYLNGDDSFWDLAVANEGSDDVSVILGGPRSTFAPERRVAVGARPRALLQADLDHAAGLDLAVADSGSNTVSLLLGDDKGGFSRAKDLPVGAGPVALASYSADSDSVEDVVVADSRDGTLAVLRGTDGLPRPGPRVTLPGGAASEPVALAVRALPGRFSGSELYVAEKGNAAVQVMHAGDDRRFGRLRTVLAGVRPTALSTGSFAGDRQGDVAIADDEGRVLVLATPGASLVAADRHAVSVTAGAGAIVWSRRLGPHRYGLANQHGALAVPVSREDPRPRIGRDARGRAVLTRRRCGSRACTPVTSTLAGAHERRVAIAVPAGCRVRDLARWGAELAYVLVRTAAHGCPRTAVGLWLRRGHGRPRRVSPHADRLGDLRTGRVTWFETLYGGSGWRLRLERLGSRPVTVASGNLDCCLLKGGALGTDAVYWAESPDAVDASLSRVRFAGIRSFHCEYAPPLDGFPWAGGIAVDGDTPVYSDEYGVFRMDAPHWRRC